MPQSVNNQTTPQIVRLSKEDMEQYHKANIARIEAVENKMERLQADMSEIIEWIHNARIGARVLVGAFEKFGKLFVWIAKLSTAATAIYLFWTQVKDRIPHFW